MVACIRPAVFVAAEFCSSYLPNRLLAVQDAFQPCVLWATLAIVCQLPALLYIHMLDFWPRQNELLMA